MFAAERGEGVVTVHTTIPPRRLHCSRCGATTDQPLGWRTSHRFSALYHSEPKGNNGPNISARATPRASGWSAAQNDTAQEAMPTSEIRTTAVKSQGLLGRSSMRSVVRIPKK